MKTSLNIHTKTSSQDFTDLEDLLQTYIVSQLHVLVQIFQFTLYKCFQFTLRQYLVGNGISRSASFENVYTRTKTSLKGKRVERVRRQESDAQSSVNQSVDADDEYYRRGSDTQDDVFVVELEKGDSGIGVGLIDGLVSIVGGIYV